MLERNQTTLIAAGSLVSASAILATVSSAQVGDKNIEACYRANPPSWCGGGSSSSGGNQYGNEAARILREIQENDRRAREEAAERRRRYNEETDRIQQQRFEEDMARTQAPQQRVCEASTPDGGNREFVDCAWHQKYLEAQTLEGSGQYLKAGIAYFDAYQAHGSGYWGKHALLRSAKNMHLAGNKAEACRRNDLLSASFLDERGPADAARRKAFGCTPAYNSSAPSGGYPRTQAEKQAVIDEWITPSTRIPDGPVSKPKQRVAEPKNSKGHSCVKLTSLGGERYMTTRQGAETCDGTYCWTTQFKWQAQNICNAPMTLDYHYGDGVRRAAFLKPGTQELISCVKGIAKCNGTFKYTWYTQ